MCYLIVGRDFYLVTEDPLYSYLVSLFCGVFHFSVLPSVRRTKVTSYHVRVRFVLYNKFLGRHEGFSKKEFTLLSIFVLWSVTTETTVSPPYFSMIHVTDTRQ